MKNYININSMLYSSLSKVGGDDLIAAYSILKFGKKSKIKIFKEQNRPIYHTLKTETNLSISTLRKYIKILIKLNLCCFDRKGNFIMLGGNKINKQFNKNKIVRINVGTLIETKLNSFAVRIHTMERLQKNAIDAKYKLKNIKARQSKGFFTTKQENNFIINCERKNRTCENYTAKTVLSNQGYSTLKHGEEKSKSSGCYWRNKLVKSNIIQVKRRFHFIKKGTVKEYLQLRNFDRTITYKNGRIFKELIPSFTTAIVEPTKQIKKLEHLEFDFLHWWSGAIV